MATPKLRKRRKKLIFAGIILVLVVLGLVAFFKKKEPVITVQAEKAARRNLTELVKASGKIQPVLQVTISPEVSGEIVALPVKEGQKVKKGDLLVKIRPDNYVAARDTALANYRVALANSNTAAANLEKAQLDFGRNNALYRSNIISASDELAAKTTLDVAKASLAAASEQAAAALASVQNAETDLSKTTIVSPIDGTVSQLNSQLGERVVGTDMMAGTTIMTIAALDAMEARVDIGEVDVVGIAPGQKVKLQVDAFKDKEFNGVVTEIANSANNNVTSSSSSSAAASSSSSSDATKFQVKIRVLDQAGFLPGMSVSADIETRYRTNVITVPIQCVTMRYVPKSAVTNSTASNSPAKAVADSNSSVLAAAATNSPVVDPVSSLEDTKQVDVVFVVNGDHVKVVPVQTGVEDDNYYEITDGLKAGDQVVTGNSRAIGKDLQDGSKITASSTNSAAGPTP